MLTMANSPLCSISHALCREGILQLSELIKFLVLEQNITQEGIFRRTGSLARQNDLKSKINNGIPLNLEGCSYTVHDCASVFEGMLSDMPEPLLTDTYNVAHVQVAELCNNSDNSKEPRLIHSLQLLLLLLPQEHYDLLKDIIEMPNKTTKYVGSNKMSASSLATLFTRATEGIVTGTRSRRIGYIRLDSEYGVHIWGHRSDGTTDTALAQLYAHIQTLLESSKKRKLIKQFNKENGQVLKKFGLIENVIHKAIKSRHK